MPARKPAGYKQMKSKAGSLAPKMKLRPRVLPLIVPDSVRMPAKKQKRAKPVAPRVDRRRGAPERYRIA